MEILHRKLAILQQIHVNFIRITHSQKSLEKLVFIENIFLLNL